MALKQGSSSITAIKQGSNTITKIYQGTNLVYDAGGEAPPPGGDETFQNANGFSVGGNSFARIDSGIYFGTVETVQTLTGTQHFSFKYNANFHELELSLTDGATVFLATSLSDGSIEFTTSDNGYSGDSPAGTINDSATFKFEKAGPAVKFYKGATLLHTFNSFNNNSAMRLKGMAQREPVSFGAGINSLVKG